MHCTIVMVRDSSRQVQVLRLSGGVIYPLHLAPIPCNHSCSQWEKSNILKRWWHDLTFLENPEMVSVHSRNWMSCSPPPPGVLAPGSLVINPYMSASYNLLWMSILFNIWHFLLKEFKQQFWKNISSVIHSGRPWGLPYKVWNYTSYHIGLSWQLHLPSNPGSLWRWEGSGQ